MSIPAARQSSSEHLSEVGQLVHVRSRNWLVEKVDRSETPGQSAIVHLACAADDAQGQLLTVYWDYEIDRAIVEEEGWSDLAARGFDPPRRFAAFLHTLKWNCVTATDPNLFQSPFRAGIKLDAYQMEPLRKALRLPRVNLFIADDTGLGKTIEAGLIARELLLRKKAKTIVVAAPPSVLEQWKGELEERFGLIFEILDRAYLTRMRRERGFGVNPWRTHSRFLVSHNLLIDPTYADTMREWLGPLLPGSLLILDEAHHAAPASGGRYGIETKFTRAVRDLAGRFEHRLFLSATPHNGHSNSFSTLLELLDPYRFTCGVKVRGKKALEEAGKVYYEYRAALMVKNNEGLTKTYNRFHDPNESDPEIIKLRELHASMDRAVLDAYGWSDINTDCEFILDYEIDEEEWGDKKKPYRYRWPENVHDEVLARLLELNAQRARQESLSGAANKASKKAGDKPSKKKSKKTPGDAGQGKLF